MAKSSWNKGLHLSEEHKRKLSESHKGKPSSRRGQHVSEEAKKEHSEFMKDYYKTHKHPMLGRKHSEESIRKAVESRNITLSNPEVRKRLGESHKGQIAWNRGKIMPQEIRRTMYRNTLEQMQEIAIGRGGECTSEEYLGSGNNMGWRCKEGHEWEATPHNIKKGQWCPICLVRIGEKICRGYFEALFQEKFPKAHPNWLKSSKGKNLELDGYCKKLGLAFEYQGVQHYLPIGFFNRTHNLAKIRQHDKFKKDMCKQNNVALIQVPYTVSYERLGKWIEEECKKAGFKPIISAVEVNYKNFDVYSSKNLEEMQELAKIRGGRCLSNKYIDIFTKLTWQCGKGHIWEAKPHDIKRKTWCPVCDRERAKHDWRNQAGSASEFQKNELTRLKNLAMAKGGQCLSNNYLNNSTKLKWICKEGHIWGAKADNIKSGRWCPKCSYEYRASLRRGNIKDMQKIAESRGGRCLSDKYVNVDSKLRWRCSRGHEWEAIPSSIKRGSWCPRCSKKGINKGKHLSEKTKRKLSEANKGRRASEETKRKMSISAKASINKGRFKKGQMSGEKNPFYGKHWSEEMRKKLSDAHKGQIAWNRGRKLGQRNLEKKDSKDSNP